MFKIYTIGDFDILYKDKSLLESYGYPNKTLKLFKYFLTYRDKKILPENIIEDLWIDGNFTEPKNVLRTQISRLRKMFSEEEDGERFFTIENISGYYIFRIKDNCFLDIEEFERLINQGLSLSEIQPESSILLLKEAIDLYKGEYLGEIEYEEWIIPIRNRINRLYLKGLYTYIEILRNENMYKEIVNICEATIENDPYGEVLHIYFIEALMEIGEKSYALSHYEYITSRMYNNLGIAPSQRMRELYQRLKFYDENIQKPIDIRGLDEELEDVNEKYGALLCEPYYFKFLYNLEKRKKLRDGNTNVFLGLITIDDIGSTVLSDKRIEETMNSLMNVAWKNLRKSDVLSKWNYRQIVSLHYDIEEEDLNIIVKRLKEKLQEEVSNKNVNLLIRFKSL